MHGDKDFFPFENYFFQMTLKDNYSIFLFKYGVKLLIIIITILCMSKMMAKNHKIGVIQKNANLRPGLPFLKINLVFWPATAEFCN